MRTRLARLTAYEILKLDLADDLEASRRLRALADLIGCPDCPAGPGERCAPNCLRYASGQAMSGQAVSVAPGAARGQS